MFAFFLSLVSKAITMIISILINTVLLPMILKTQETYCPKISINFYIYYTDLYKSVHRNIYNNF